jgi:hypothetical protein
VSKFRLYPSAYSYELPTYLIITQGAAGYEPAPWHISLLQFFLHGTSYFVATLRIHVIPAHFQFDLDRSFFAS